VGIRCAAGIVEVGEGALMGFRRAKDREETPAEIVDIRRQLAQDDPLVFQVASQAVSDWRERFPHIARAAGAADDRATRSTRMLSEAFTAASATRTAVAAGGGQPGPIFSEQFGISQEQAGMGVSKEWVVALMQIRCFASGYMLGVLGRRQDCDELGRLFNAFVEQVERAK
jgi:hypothetical protein